MGFVFGYYHQLIMFGWTTAQLPLLLILPILLIGSAFFSGSETALFGLSHSERMALLKNKGGAGRAIDQLLSNQRMLLITILLGNMIINVLYFVVSSVLLIKAVDANWFERVLLGIATLSLIIIFGEVVPKLIANSRRQKIAPLIATTMLALHSAITPLRILLDKLVISPLSRLTAPTHAPPTLDADEIGRLLELSSDEGVIDEDETRVLKDIIELGNRRVSDVMTPRVKVHSLPMEANREDVIKLAEETQLTKFPVHKGSLDNIAGILNVKRFLLEDNTQLILESGAVSPARFIPELATLDVLLEDFRKTRTQIAVAVDEYGGTAGLIAIEDIVREILGELREGKANTDDSIKESDS